MLNFICRLFYMRQLLILLIFCTSVLRLNAQELNARVTVLSNRMPTTVDRKIFQTLQTSLQNFLNNRKWTKLSYKPAERIECSFLLNLERTPEPNVYEATLTVQAGRPVYNANYLSPIINFQDPAVSFRYVEFQPMEFNENRVSTGDPLISNLTAVFAFYVYVILGADHDSFTQRGGDPYFQSALNIVNNAPDARYITGWKSFDGIRNRYWLAENFINSRYAVMHDVYYSYYRRGFDMMYEDEQTARDAMMNAIIYLENLHKDIPNLMLLQFFLLGKADELINVFKKAPVDVKQRARDILSRIDIANAARYKQDLK